ncbi:malonate--CoA ligase [Aliiruegeria lutimaris]|uniref:Malonyl-CoA/methylmalonyl-CoA synthetase n=1 Tax=Aliiruegeria lutimaris TaxID=571298 RepID=A0A1G9GNW6_9RHOB|nr:malonyl-CoA synthase [Aliiruegeria lutimaris]SDL02312.1 malonyl-CoA/methylmalonyl-CoA synthetase [Aliiruegeria lutimaris]
MPNHLFDAMFAPRNDSAKVFLHHPDGSTLSHAEFAQIAARQASVMRNMGVAKGDRVALQVAKTPEALAVYAASIRIGAVLLPLNTAYTPEEVAYFVSDAEPKMLICDPRSQESLAEIAASVGASLMTLDADGNGILSSEAARTAPLDDVAECSAEDLAAILYTSGTTGRSKGAMLSHDNLLSNAQALTDLWRFTDADTLIHALPIFHTHGLFVAINVSLLSGTAIRFFPKFDLDAIIEALSGSTTLMGVPTFFTRLLADPRLTRERVSAMRLFVSGSAPLLAATHEEFEARTGHRILERYGMTETNMNASNPYEGERIAGTVGMPLPGVEIRITEPGSENELPRGETGMIEVRGPNVFKGYWRMPEKTAEELRADGFFLTGDLGLIDEKDYLHIVGRQKDLIIAGGYNIYPKEIEVLLDSMEGVQESAVIGVPHPDLGETVVAVVVPIAGAQIDPDSLLAGISERLARFKHPRRLVVVDSLPRNTMGKVQKNALREAYAGCLS